MECHSPWWVEFVTGVANPLVTLIVLWVNVRQNRQIDAIASSDRPRSRS
jgi:hypothetical protein